MQFRLSPEQIANTLRRPAPTPQQAAIIASPLAPALVIAGAGSGKTETMAARVVALVANGLVPAQHILGLTFTRKAAGELSARIRTRLAQLRHHGLCEDIGEPTVSTYHAYAGRIVSEHALRGGFEPTAQLLGDAMCWQFADVLVNHYDGDMSAVDAAPDTVTDKVRGLAGELAEHLQSTADLAAYLERFCADIAALPGKTPAAVRTLLARQKAKLSLLPLVEAFNQRKQAIEAMDFGDQLARAAALAQAHTQIGATERARYRVVLLDEYQDTSFAQLVLLQELFGGGHPVMAVGDPCQSIYGWRGASAGNLMRFPTDFPQRNNKNARVYPLTISWRNEPQILAAANTLSEPLRADERVTVPPLEPRPGAGSGELLCGLHNTVIDEAHWIADNIATQWEKSSEPPTTAVLVRNRQQFEPLAEALRARGLPVEIVGVAGLLSTAEITDLVATLRVISNPTAGADLLRLLTGARWRIGPRDLLALKKRSLELVGEEHSGEASIIEALADLGPASDYSPAAYRRLRALADQLRYLRGRTGQPLPELVAETERVLGLDIEVVVRRPREPAAARAHLDAFAQVVADFDNAAEHPTLSALLAYLAAAERTERGLQAGQVEVTEGAVQLLTVHGSKGLEWDIVAVPGLTSGVFPAKKQESARWTHNLGALPAALRGDHADLPDLNLTAIEDQPGLGKELKAFEGRWADYELAEERRLAYVALTRARRVLLCSGYWWSASATTRRGPSTLLTEIYEHCDKQAHVWAPEPDEDLKNPLLTNARTVLWPHDPLGERREPLELAAALVNTPNEGDPDEQERRWGHEARLLLAERASRSPNTATEVPLPTHLTVSNLVALHQDPELLAQQVRRPMPRRPAPYARRGTAFHGWLERRFSPTQLLDFGELPGAGDSDAADDQELAELQAKFLESEWADKTPHQVEVAFATVINGVVVRGRMDAVFRATVDGAPGWDVVDWKTGRAPTQLGSQSVQLAAYRLAWAELTNTPISRVRAAFHYVADGRTIRPVDLLNSEQLAALLP
ncbi:MAG: ATP-dependent helicase [Corynebacteriales bacterium]|nr:ATP-dependent helicase [Mycobacteriales bacterium]